MKICSVYATKNGSSAEIAHYITHQLVELGHEVSIQRADEVEQIIGYDAIIMGTPIYNGDWLPELQEFATHHVKKLCRKPTFLWVACIRVLEDAGLAYVQQHYHPQELVDEIQFRMQAVFAGKLDLSSIDFDERWALALHYDGQTEPSDFDSDYRDWEQIATFAQEVDRVLSQT